MDAVRAAGPSRGRSAAELLAVFFALPIAVALLAPSWQPLWLLALLAVLAGVELWRHREPGIAVWSIGPSGRALLARLLLVWLASAVVLAAGVQLWRPERLFALPRQQTRAWIELLVLYPFVSVLPQEVLYRAFFFHRYRALLGEGALALIANATLFAWMHLVFHNVVAVALTFLGGLLFAATYRRSHSLGLVALQHVLYGWTVFSIGLDPFFLGASLQR